MDGEHLYTSNADRNGIWIVNADGSMERVIDDLEPHQWYNWRVFSSGIYYIGEDEDGHPALKKYDGNDTTVIRSLPDWPETPGLTISPDEKSVLLVYENDGESDIMIARYP